MPRKRSAKSASTLVPLRSPQLAELLEAAKTCRLEPLRRFLAAGGAPDTLVELKFVDGTSKLAPMICKAITTHHMVQDPAFHHGSLDLLLQSGASANTTYLDAGGHDSTALILACSSNCCTTPVRLLLAHGAEPAMQTSLGHTALHSAATAGWVDACKMLLDSGGCETDVCDSTGSTPLVCAVHKGHVRVVELLHRQGGASVSSRRPNGATLLHLAAVSGQRPLLEYLLHNGLAVDAVTQEAVTPLHIAAQKGNAAALQVLLEHGASPAALNSHGQSLLMAAVKGKQTGMVELLLSKRLHSLQHVDVNATAAEGDTALHPSSIQQLHCCSSCPAAAWRSCGCI
jgi:ankyrin repeat protein